MKIKKALILIVSTLVIVLLIVLNIKFKNVSSSFTEDLSIPINFDEETYVYKNFIYILSKSNIRILKDNVEIAKDSFNLENYHVVKEKDKLAIGDKNTKTVRIYSSNGLLYTINHNNNILSFNINEEGFCGIISKDNSNYEILVFNNLGKNVLTLKNIDPSESIPINLSISKNGKSLAVSFLKITDIFPQTNISIYSISNSSEDKSNMFGAFKKDKQITGIIKFLGNNLLALSDKEFSIIKVNGNNFEAKEVQKTPLSNKIENIGFLNDDSFFISYGAKLLPESKIEPNTSIFYTSSGSYKDKYETKSITDIFTSDLGTVLEQGKVFSAFSENGSLLWEYQSTQDIKSIYIFNSKNTALITTNNEAKIVKINKKYINGPLNESSTEVSEEEQSLESTTKNTSKVGT